MQIDTIEHLAAKYLEVGLDGHQIFVRQLEDETEEATFLWQEEVEGLVGDDRREFELLVDELRLATN
ncbi:hypothetical protein QO002_005515 [Pararhizobium capsulatum DSM 1112]|uniref:Uncharacterized protein n=1 Tax=Pararhizobium capsulatum DSM 1112 TaxID=1121113 RepID=A0ABU0BYH5_9HYPH|nr:hypothetical protein [Pararhizobium capsulatum]MDQ0323309.1 hypothetical protein [Pararhizobium capsulatum DSM 1112]